MKEAVLEILKKWGFETDDVCSLSAHKKMCNGYFIYDPYSEAENDELVFSFFSDTEESPSRRCLSHKIIRCEQLRQMPAQGIESYLKVVCRNIVDSVVAKILFEK